MDNPQLVDYIRSQMAAGHTEVTIRDHLVKHGWPTEKVDEAFEHYNRSHVVSEPPAPSEAADHEPKPAAAHPRRGGRETVRRNKSKLWVGMVVVVLVVAGGIGIFLMLQNHEDEAEPLAVREPTIQQKQSLDIVTLGGAVGQYVATNDKRLPTSVSAAPDGSNSVVLCGAVCDPSSWQVSSLSAYKPSGVKMVSYSPGLDVADASTLLLVSDARCNTDHTELSTKDVKPLSMAILYANQEGATLKEHCVVL